jgi:hypothetical protein
MDRFPGRFIAQSVQQIALNLSRKLSGGSPPGTTPAHTNVMFIRCNRRRHSLPQSPTLNLLKKCVCFRPRFKIGIGHIS